MILHNECKNSLFKITSCMHFFLQDITGGSQIIMKLKVIRKYLLNHNKSFRWHLGDYEKHTFFNLKAYERRKFDFCVFLRMFSGSVKNRFYKLNGGSGRRHAVVIPASWPTTHRKNTQKSKVLLSQAFKWKKSMFFVIPEMTSKTFVMF